LKPCFEVPKEKLLDIEKLKSKAKPLKMALKIPTKVAITRTDLAPNWD
jgi:hypothetical protein